MNDELMRAQGEEADRARMMAAQRAIAGGLGSPLSPPADFYSLLCRIRQAIIEASEARAHARSIADTMHGSAGELSGAGCARDSRVGLIGQYEDALDELMAVLSDTRSNLRRISNGIPDQPKSTLG